MFSRRTGWDREESSLARAIGERRERGLPIIDLTRSNPTECGLGLAPALVLQCFKDERVLRYEPDPRGSLTAREAVAAYYADHGAPVSADRVMLTASTSEAYSELFHLLCDPGDEVLIAQPSYPLFDYLGDLADVRMRPYRLFYDFGWWIDFADLEQAITPRTRAVVVVHPNNPTGHATSRPERERLRQLCAERDLALIVDEVFLDYGLGDQPIESFAADESSTLCFVLSGLSKVAGLPQMKLGWIVTSGPEARCREALARMEIIADTFLSVNTPAQIALPEWLGARDGLQEAICKRLRANLQALRGAGLQVLMADGGWSAILRLPVTATGSWAEQLVSHGVLVHPGEFYGIGEDGRVVLSLLTPTDDLVRGAQVIRALIGGETGLQAGEG